MDLDSWIGSISTVVAVLTFLGIVAWAYSARRKPAFEEAANAPFAVPDEVADDLGADRGRVRQ